MKMHAYRYISIFTAKNRSLFSSGCGAEKAKTPQLYYYAEVVQQQGGGGSRGVSSSSNSSAAAFIAPNLNSSRRKAAQSFPLI